MAGPEKSKRAARIEPLRLRTTMPADAVNQTLYASGVTPLKM